MGIGIDVVQPYPHAQFAQPARQIVDVAPPGAAVPLARAMMEIDTVGAGVLRDHQKLLDPCGHQALGLAEDQADGAAL